MIKSIDISENGGFNVLWKNDSQYEGFVKSRIQTFNRLGFFSENTNPKNKSEFLRLASEVLALIEEDKKHPSILNSSLKYSIDSHKDEIIYYVNVCYFIGVIIFETFDSETNRMKSGKNNGKLSIDLFGMFKEAYESLVESKANRCPNIYGSTLTFMSLIELTMKQDTKIEIIGRCLMELQKRHVTEQSEIRLITFLKNAINHIPDDSFDFMKSTTTDAINLFDKYALLYNDEERSLINNTLTFNQLLDSVCFKKNTDGSSRVDSDFLTLMDYTFKQKKLNLRNQMSHGYIGCINYYAIAMCSYLLFLHIIVHNKYYLK